MTKSARLEGKVALITGAAKGMGASHVHVFAREGAKVIATDYNLEGVQKVVEEVNKEFPGSAVAFQLNVAIEADWKEVTKKAYEQFGKINVLINNAGILDIAPFDKLTHEQWNRVMDVDAWGVFVGMREVLPYMKEDGVGSIINLSSIAAINASGGLSTYTAAKGAVTALTRAAAIEFAPFNVRVNTVHPGTIDTNMFREGFPTDELRHAAENGQPLRRVGTTEEVSYLMVYLASDESGFTTGTSQVIDGGYTVQAGDIAAVSSED
jgi:NAD(P)-dependent dehydrogenase (short-subunit alcohol dehydrogenase family)